MFIKQKIEIKPTEVLLQCNPDGILEFLRIYHPKFYAKMVDKIPDPPPSDYYDVGQWFKRNEYGISEYYVLTCIANRVHLMNFNSRNGYLGRWNDIGLPLCDGNKVFKTDFEAMVKEYCEMKPIDFSEVILEICQRS